MKTPKFLKGTPKLDKSQMEVIKSEVISWPKIQNTLRCSPTDKIIWIQHYLLTEYNDMCRTHILKRLVGAYIGETEKLTGQKFKRADLYKDLGIK